MRSLEEINKDIVAVCSQLGATEYQKHFLVEQLDEKIAVMLTKLKELEQEQKNAQTVKDELEKTKTAETPAS